MDDIAYKNGFLCGLLATGIEIGGGSSGSGSNEELPAIDCLKCISLRGYNNATTSLQTTYKTVISSQLSYMPKQGYVSIGGYDLHDFESFEWWDMPEATLKVTADGVVLFEGSMWDYFEDVSVQPPCMFQYNSSFEVMAKRENMTDGMEFSLLNTMIIGLK